MTSTTGTDLTPLAVNHEAILRTLNLNPRDANTQALLLICDRYGLDPLMHHVVLIQGRPYVTRDGYLSVAHRSGQLDGIEVLDEGEDDDGHWWARVSVHRKDMSHPFTYKGRYPKTGGNRTYGPEMAIKCAEVAALRRAFNVTGIGAADEKWDTDDVATAVPANGAGKRSTGRLTEDEGQQLAEWLLRLEQLDSDSETHAELVRELKPITAGKKLTDAPPARQRKALAVLERHAPEILAAIGESVEEPWPMDPDPANPAQRPFVDDKVPEEADPKAGDEAG